METGPVQLESLLEEVRDLFTVETGELKRITEKFASELRKGLSSQGGSSIPMNHTWVTSLPSGREKGSYLVMEMGRTHLRVSHITLPELKNAELKIHQSKYQIPEQLRDSEAEDLWNQLVSFLQDYISENRLEPRQGEKLPLAFVFSYPMTQHRIDVGILQRWTKGFSVRGVEGENVARQFEDALSKQQLPVSVVAITNDTTATLMASAYMDPETKIGCVFGEGCNAAYIEDCGAISSPDLIDVSPDTPMVINCEWGAFDNEHEILPRTPYDRIVDEKSPRPGQQTFEKMVAGHYLGEIFRLVIVMAHEKGLIFDGQSIDKIKEPYSLDSSVVSIIEQYCSEGFQGIKELFRSKMHISCTQLELYFIHDTAELIISRAAHLSACGIAAICKKKGYRACRVGAEGSLYEKNTHFTSQISHALAEILDWPERRDGDPVAMFHSGGSGVGAAVIAALTLGRGDKT
ncbi:putative hexokinase Kxk [Mariannaea sp. PMI_226]|nr:putative hexokinase Kxk [Mariannaea sp. PMI_226]